MNLAAHFLRGAIRCGSSRRLYSLRARFVVSLVLLCTAAVPNVRAQKKTQPTVEISFPNYSYPETLTSLHQLDLKNSEFIFFGEKGTPDLRARLRRGAYEKLNKIGGDSAEFEWMKYVGNGSVEPDYALAYYVWASWAGSSSSYGVVQLLSIKDGHLKISQQILFNLRGSERAGAYFGAKANTLTIRGVNDWEHCCPTGLDVVQFQTKDGVLKQVHYGKAPLA